MLRNYVIGTQKFTLFVDEIGLERQSTEIIKEILKDQNEKIQIFPDLELEAKSTELEVDFDGKSNVILVPIAKLAVHYNIQSIFELIHKLKVNKNVKQIFAWITVKILRNPLLQSFLEHISDTTISINSEDLLTITTRKSSGSVRTKQYNHEILKKSFAIKEYKPEQKPADEDFIDPLSLGTFKIGQFKDNELEAKKSLQLPFEYHRNPEAKEAGQILYTPDLEDDFDDEDPDDDLLV